MNAFYAYLCLLFCGDFFQSHGKSRIALFKILNRSHNLLAGGILAGSLQLLSQLHQFTGMCGVVIHHVAHQSLQLRHGCAVLVVIVVMMVMVMMIVIMVMLMTVGMLMIVVMLVNMSLIMQMLMGMRMLMTVLVGVVVLVRMGMSTVAMLVDMGMIVAVGVHMFHGNQSPSILTAVRSEG